MASGMTVKNLKVTDNSITLAYDVRNLLTIMWTAQIVLQVMAVNDSTSRNPVPLTTVNDAVPHVLMPCSTLYQATVLQR